MVEVPLIRYCDNLDHSLDLGFLVPGVLKDIFLKVSYLFLYCFMLQKVAVLQRTCRVTSSSVTSTLVIRLVQMFPSLAVWIWLCQAAP